MRRVPLLCEQCLQRSSRAQVLIVKRIKLDYLPNPSPHSVPNKKGQPAKTPAEPSKISPVFFIKQSK
jgi:hypothetical protein